MFVKFSKKDKERATKLYRKGKTLREISEIIGCSKGTPAVWFKDLPKVKKIGPPKGNDPWNKGQKFSLMIGNKHASRGEKVKKGARYYRMRQSIKKKEKCERCPNKKLLVLHHINRDIRDNKSANILTLCRKCHINEHRSELKP